MLVVDTSVLIDFFKGKNTPQTNFLFSFEDQGGVIAIPCFVVAEILQGAKSLKEWRLLDTYLISQEILYPKDQLEFFKKSAKIFYDLRKKGKTVRSTMDCMIAQLTLEVKGTLLHADKDFEIIETVRDLKTWQE